MLLPVWSRCALGTVMLVGCGFAPAGGNRPADDDDDAGPGDPDAAIDVDARAIDARAIDAAPPVDLPFLDPSNEQPGTGDWIVTQDVDFDSDLDPAAPGIDGLPPGVTFTLQTQNVTGARTILVMHVGRLELTEGNAFYMYGSRPVAIVAGDDVVIAGTIDASAWTATDGTRSAGPGGFSGADAIGAGGGGATAVAPGNSDTGGGGGAHGTAGGRGGGAGCVADVCTVAPGGGGMPMNADLLYLGGGGHGGTAPTRGTCTARTAGAGGGGLFVYSPTSITVQSSGVIEANGGGGGGGRFCVNVGTLAGSGGGAGGQIDLMSPTVSVADGGLVIANGGGGGGGANNTGNGNDGAAGEDGADSLSAGAPGGGGSGTGGDGGSGSVGGGMGGKGEDIALGANGGAGGGGGGRIAIRYRAVQPIIVTSPPALIVSY